MTLISTFIIICLLIKKLSPFISSKYFFETIKQFYYELFLVCFFSSIIYLYVYIWQMFLSGYIPCMKLVLRSSTSTFRQVLSNLLERFLFALGAADAGDSIFVRVLCDCSVVLRDWYGIMPLVRVLVLDASSSILRCYSQTG